MEREREGGIIYSYILHPLEIIIGFNIDTFSFEESAVVLTGQIAIEINSGQTTEQNPEVIVAFTDTSKSLLPAIS